nr:immunoglobulin light chain junction region [Macaca mulatta]
CIQGLEFPITF